MSQQHPDNLRYALDFLGRIKSAQESTNYWSKRALEFLVSTHAISGARDLSPETAIEYLNDYIAGQMVDKVRREEYEKSKGGA